MNSGKSNVWFAAVALTALALFVLNPIIAGAQSTRAGREKKEEQGREMTFVGTIVDVHSFMTGKHSSNDHARSTAEAIRSGIPAAIDTPIGLIIIGQGTTGASKTLVPLAHTRALVTGKFYEKNGLKYLDLASARSAENEGEDVEESEE